MKGLKQVGAVFLMVTGGSAFAWRPLTIDEAYPMELGKFELDAGVAYAHDSEVKAWESPAGLTAGILPNMDACVGFGGMFEERKTGDGHDCVSGCSDFGLGTKWMFLKEKESLPAMSLVAVVKLPTADDSNGLGTGKPHYDLTWMASKKLGEKTGIHVNAGYCWAGQPEGEEGGDVVHYGLALDYQLTESVQWVGEVFAEKELQDDTQTCVQYNTGFRWSASDSLTLDIAAGSRLRGDEAPDFTATTGLTWAFGL